MRKRDKKQLIRIIVSAVLLAIAWSIEHFSLMPTVLTVEEFDLQTLLLFSIPYFVIGYNVLWRAARNIVRGQIFDENFLMSIATIGAFVTGEYAEAVFVMLFYSVGELFEHIAVGKSRKSIKSLLSIRVDTAFVENEKGELEEAFGSGTAAVVSPVGHLAWNDREITISGGEIGTLTQKLYDTLTGIQMGRIAPPEGWVVQVL